MNKKMSTFSWIIGAVILAIFLRVVFIGVFKVPTITMAPTLLAGDFIISNKLAYGIKEKNPARGDVIVFVRSEKLGQYFIKRVVAVPGDVLEISAGELKINGEKCVYVSEQKIENFEIFTETCLNSKRHILRALTGQLKTPDLAPKTLKEGEFFVLGDNRDASEDSRDWGPIAADQVSGKAQLIWLSVGSTQDSISQEKGLRLSRFLTTIQ
ncbi:signal peptidase I [Bdellovibrio sp. qaytius]|nr:signal peptidase I [Bdellovibrio sp. qaytius]